MQFRLLTVLYVFALLAAGMAVFGGWGIFASVAVFAIWWLIFNGGVRGVTVLQAFCLLPVCLAFVFIMIELFMPRVFVSREATREAKCFMKLRQIAIALQVYERSEAHLPPARTANENREVLHGWRLDILPYIDEQSTWKNWNHDLPYTDPVKTLVAKSQLQTYVCPGDPPSQWNSPQCNYFAVVGPDSAWANPSGTKLKEIGDPRSETILLLETAGKGINWAEPRELSFKEALKILVGRSQDTIVHTNRRQTDTFFSSLYVEVPGVHAAFANGSVRFLPVPLDEKLARALLTANGGEVIPPGTLDALTDPRLNYARIYGLCVFVVLALLPGFVVWRRRSRTSLPVAVVRS